MYSIVQKPSTKSLKGRKRQAPFLSISILNTLAECVYLSEHPLAEGAVRTFHWSILTFIFMSTAQGRKLQYYRKLLQPPTQDFCSRICLVALDFSLKLQDKICSRKPGFESRESSHFLDSINDTVPSTQAGAHRCTALTVLHVVWQWQGSLWKQYYVRRLAPEMLSC